MVAPTTDRESTTMNSPNLHGKTCLVTGGAGFIGSHLVERLLRDGNTVRVIDNLSTGTRANLERFMGTPAFEFVAGDVEDTALMERLMRGVDVVFHLAAAVGVKLIVAKPVRTIQTNVLGTETVLRLAAHHGCRVVLASSSEVYGKVRKVPFAETDDVILGAPASPRWGYAASKMLSEFLAMAHWRESRLQVVCARLFNTIGPGQTGEYGMVVPRLVRQALRNEPLTVYGDGSQTRCFCHVSDVAEALIGLAAHPDTPGQIFNVGSTEETTILALARLILELTGSQSRIELVPFESVYGPGFEDMHRRVPDISRIQNVLGWTPKKSLREAVADVIEFERAQPAGAQQ